MIESRAPRRMRHSWEARCRLVRLMLGGVAPSQAAVVCGASRATAYRALARYRVGGWEALRDRPPIARSHPARLSSEAERQIVALRRATGWGPKRLAGVLGWPAATIWRVLCRHGISRRAAAPRPPANRHEYAAPGELVHLDIKQLGRFWQIGNGLWRERWASQSTSGLELSAPGCRRSLAVCGRATAPDADQR